METLHALLLPETAGDPMTGLKWTRKTTRRISDELGTAGLTVSRTTVARLLKDLHYALRVNHKKLAGSRHPQRNEQFEYLSAQRRYCEAQGRPWISVDTKKKELIGLFKNAGTVWAQHPRLVNDHDFRSTASGIAIPYGVFDAQANRGHLFVGTSHDTSAFAVASVAQWWATAGRRTYPGATELHILADGGGSNGARCRAWRYELQHRLCDSFGLTVTVGHYPPGTSKWNPIEHRLFSEVTKHWAGEPLESYDKMLNFIRTTTTTGGLVVNATLNDADFPTGIKISDDQMKQLNIRPHPVCPAWNYTISPARKM